METITETAEPAAEPMAEEPFVVVVIARNDPAGWTTEEAYELLMEKIAHAAE